MTWAWIVAILIAVPAAFVTVTPTGRYLGRAAWEESKILSRRRPIDEIVRDTTVDAVTRGKLSLVLEARQFAVDSLGLDAKRSFTQYTRLDRDTLVLVLSGARRDRLEPVTWWFPVVGRVPYKGYFDFAEGAAARDELARRGYDADLRPAGAFSTLGWFDDPLLSTTLADDSLGLAETVIHELLHNTFYAGGQAVFNESFANFAGHRGAAAFFRARGDTTAVRRVEERWEDQKALGAFWTSLHATLDSAFKAHDADSLARLAARETLFVAARARLVDTIGPTLKAMPAGYASRARIDNGAVMARRIYLTELASFDGLLVAEGGSVRAAIVRIAEAAKRNKADPFAAIRR